ncbi:MAG: hypothetical protein M1837_002472 [Sclerophora amabilis]|nr:MAG: hypothetical protein M1837_002472 [Sclerophora amabilis]
MSLEQDGPVGSPTPPFRTADANQARQWPPPSHPQRKPQPKADALLMNLSPSAMLDALSLPHQDRLGDSLGASIARATPAERDFAYRAATASQKLQTWCDELSSWEWPAKGSSAGAGVFETIDGHGRLRNHQEMLDCGKSIGAGEGPNELEKATGLGSNVQAKETSQRNGIAEKEEEEEYWGSLPARMVRDRDARIGIIEENLENLDLGELKNQALDVHVPSRSRRNSLERSQDYSNLSSYNLLEDVTALTTAMVLQSLPFASRLSDLLNVWSTRLRVLQSIPVFFSRLEDANLALNSAWNVLDSPRKRYASREPQISGSLQGSSEEKPSPGLSRDDFNTVRSVVGESVTLLGKSVDHMLDALEGREETIPDKWIDAVEGIETDYTAWVVEAGRLVSAKEWKRKIQAQLQQTRSTEEGPQDYQPGNNDEIDDRSRNVLDFSEADAKKTEQQDSLGVVLDEPRRRESAHEGDRGLIASPSGLIENDAQSIAEGQDCDTGDLSGLANGKQQSDPLPEVQTNTSSHDSPVLISPNTNRPPSYENDAQDKAEGQGCDTGDPSGLANGKQQLEPLSEVQTNSSSYDSPILITPNPNRPLSYKAEEPPSVDAHKIPVTSRLQTTLPDSVGLETPPVPESPDEPRSCSHPRLEPGSLKRLENPLTEESSSELPSPGSATEEYLSGPRSPEIADASAAGFFRPQVVSTPPSTRGSMDGMVRTPCTSSSRLTKQSSEGQAPREYFEISPPRMKPRVLDYSNELPNEEDDGNKSERDSIPLPNRASVASVGSIQKGEVKTIDIRTRGSFSSMSSASSPPRPESGSLRKQAKRRSDNGGNGLNGVIDTSFSSPASSINLKDEADQPSTRSSFREEGKVAEDGNLPTMPPSIPLRSAHREPATPEPPAGDRTEQGPSDSDLTKSGLNGVAARKSLAKFLFANRGDQLEQKISSILTTIPAHIRLTTETDEQSTPTKSTAKTPEPTTPAPRMMHKRTESPSFTLALAETKAAPRQKSQNAPAQDVKLYHLRRAGAEAPIKLFVRLVGESGERVMVRVGGGWADLGEYLREYASHHGRRSVSNGKIEVQDAPTSVSSSGAGGTPNPTSATATPGSSNRQSPGVLDSSSALHIRKTRRPSSRLSSTGPESPSLALSTSAQDDSNNTPSPATGTASRSSSRPMWTSDDVHNLGLAGPKSKKPDPLSPQKQAWVDGVIGQVRKASGGVGSLTTATTAKDTERRQKSLNALPPSGGGGSGRGDDEDAKAGFKELSKAGGTTRVYRKGPLNQWQI